MPCERMTTKEWREILLDHGDTINYRGNVVTLVVKSMGCGVVEVFKKEQS